MNIENGRIYDVEEFKKMKEELLNNSFDYKEKLDKLNKKFVKIEEVDMTEKQKEEKQVSLKDHKSKLGKKLTEERRIRRNIE